MCLVSKSYLPKIASENIYCCKHMNVFRRQDGTIGFQTPFTMHDYTNDLVENGEMRAKIWSVVRYFISMMNPFKLIDFWQMESIHIGGGFIHVAADSAIRFGGSIPIMCYIPKGTLYYEEKDCFGEPRVYAAQKIVIIDDNFLKRAVKKVKKVKKVKEDLVSKMSSSGKVLTMLKGPSGFKKRKKKKRRSLTQKQRSKH